MRILIVLTYYRPHTSGLTIYAERLAKAFVKRGHQVTVLTSQYEKDLPQQEVCDGVQIVRVPVLFRVSKGVIMPTFGMLANKLVMEHDVVQLHLPQFDAAGVALRGRLLKKPTVITYHCDLYMPPGLLSWLANQAVYLMNNLAALVTHRIVTYTRDYAEHSFYLKKHLDKLKVILPPVELPEITQEAIEKFAVANNPDKRRPVIGMAARFATEKGVEVLLGALPKLFEVYPDALIQFAGAYENIIGEEHYYERLMPQIKKYEDEGRWRFSGILDPVQMAAFYPNIDILVLPSINSTEAFGLVQIEAMFNKAVCIASDLPGVRQPVKMHEMGEIIPIGDSEKLGEALVRILNNKEQYIKDPAKIKEQYIPESVAIEYEKLFLEIQDELKSK